MFQGLPEGVPALHPFYSGGLIASPRSPDKLGTPTTCVKLFGLCPKNLWLPNAPKIFYFNHCWLKNPLVAWLGIGTPPLMRFPVTFGLKMSDNGISIKNLTSCKCSAIGLWTVKQLVKIQKDIGHSLQLMQEIYPRDQLSYLWNGIWIIYRKFDGGRLTQTS